MKGFVKRKPEQVVGLDLFYMKAYDVNYKIIRTQENEYKIYGVKKDDLITVWRKSDILSSGHQFGIIKKNNTLAYS